MNLNVNKKDILIKRQQKIIPLTLIIKYPKSVIDMITLNIRSKKRFNVNNLFTKNK